MTLNHVNRGEIETLASADWIDSPGLRAEFRGNREQYMAYRRGVAQGHTGIVNSTKRRRDVIEAVNAVARTCAFSNINTAAHRLWTEDSKVRKVFGSLPRLAEHMTYIKGAATKQSPPHPAAA